MVRLLGCEGTSKDLRDRAYALFHHIGDLALEQLVAYDERMVVTHRCPGVELSRLSADEIDGISVKHLEDLAAAFMSACKKPFHFDSIGMDNCLLYKEEGGGITVVDYMLGSWPPEPAFEQFGRFVSDTLYQLVRSSSDRETRRAWYGVYTRGLQVLAERDPESYATLQQRLTWQYAAT